MKIRRVAAQIARQPAQISQFCSHVGVSRDLGMSVEEIACAAGALVCDRLKEIGHGLWIEASVV